MGTSPSITVSETMDRTVSLQLHDAVCWSRARCWHNGTYLLAPYSTVLLEKLTGFQLVEKFTAFY